MITQEQVKSIFIYDNGDLIRKKTSGGSISGSVAGYFGSGYGVVKIRNKAYKIHRVIYLYHHGLLPEMIDHIDNNPLNNKIENLRPCSRSQNKMNCKVSKSNISKVKGVSWSADKGKWVARLTLNGKEMFFGYFRSVNGAAKAISKERALYHGRFSRN